MKTLYQCSEWQGASGLWHCEHIGMCENRETQKWVIPARILNISPAEFIKWLIANYNPDVVYHNEDCSFVGWAWKDKDAMRNYKNYINLLARKKNFTV